MNDGLEVIKSNTILFTIELTKNTLSDWIVDDIVELNKELGSYPILKTEFKTNQDIKRLKDFLKREVKQLDADLYDSCLEELTEIKDDLKWQNSEDGKLVLELENWVQNTRRIIMNEGWNSLFVGRSIIDPKQLNIGGFVKDEQQVRKIKSEVEKLAPPVYPNFYLEVEQKTNCY
ncbi:hypothetical protein [Rufibacter roseus]|uniref:Uncharacterized protein n=1 Tax=Rufibacter roseus TaxID=1567108 RepID=A0ABW2DRA6_9BACT|nr:hypothetical protein [Rufibacter roseus]